MAPSTTPHRTHTPPKPYVCECVLCTGARRERGMGYRLGERSSPGEGSQRLAAIGTPVSCDLPQGRRASCLSFQREDLHSTFCQLRRTLVTGRRKTCLCMMQQCRVHCCWWSEVEGCIGIGFRRVPRDPTQISRERAVLTLLQAGAGG